MSSHGPADAAHGRCAAGLQVGCRAGRDAGPDCRMNEPLSRYNATVTLGAMSAFFPILLYSR